MVTLPRGPPSHRACGAYSILIPAVFRNRKRFANTREARRRNSPGCRAFFQTDRITNRPANKDSTAPVDTALLSIDEPRKGIGEWLDTDSSLVGDYRAC